MSVANLPVQWRLCLLLSILYLVIGIYSAPLDHSSDEDSLLPALEAVSRARRDTRKAVRNTQPVRGLVRYRYPVHVKRSRSFELENDDNPEMDPLDMLTEENSEDVNGISQLAKEMALELLLESADKNEEPYPTEDDDDDDDMVVADTNNRKKFRRIQHAVEDAEADEWNDKKKKKRFQSWMEQFIDNEENRSDDEDDREDDDDEEAQLLYRKALNVINEMNNGPDRHVTDEEEEAIYEAVLRALQEEGIEEAEIESLLNKLGEDQRPDYWKRSSTWKKLPRASVRWRSRHQEDNSNEGPAGFKRYRDEHDENVHHRMSSNNREDHSSKGFHRNLAGFRDDNHRGTSKREQYPWPLRNPSSEIKKRSVQQEIPANKEDEQASNGQDNLLADSRDHFIRKKRSLSSSASDEHSSGVSATRAAERKMSTSSPDPNRNNNKRQGDNDTSISIVNSKKNETNSTALYKKSRFNKGVHLSNIRKKSVNLEDYFGYDKRSGGRHPSGDEDDDEDDVNDDDHDGDDDDVKDFLDSEYYRMLAASLASRRKRGYAEHGMDMKRKRNSVSRQHPDWDDFPLDAKKRRSSWAKRRRALTLDDDDERWGDTEAALAAAFQAAEQRQESDEMEQFKDELVNELAEQLDEEGLHSFNRLRQIVAKILEDIEDEPGQEETLLEASHDMNLPWKASRSWEQQQDLSKKKKKQDDRRKKRHPLGFGNVVSPNKMPWQLEEMNFDDNKCPIAGRVMMTCNVVAHLMGGYRQLLNDACTKYEACSLCSEDDGVCDEDFQRRVMTLCGPDLLCRSQSRRVLSALNDIHGIDDGFLQGNQEQLDVMCGSDPCLARIWKRR